MRSRRDWILGVCARLAAEAEDDVHLDDLIAFRRRHIAGELHSLKWNVVDMTRIFKQEMAMIARIRIEKRLCPLNRQGAHNANLSKEIKHIIDGRQRGPHF